jgi:hypothetical protein
MSEKAVSNKSLAKVFDVPWWLLLIDGIALRPEDLIIPQSR